MGFLGIKNPREIPDPGDWALRFSRPKNFQKIPEKTHSGNFAKARGLSVPGIFGDRIFRGLGLFPWDRI